MRWKVEPYDNVTHHYGTVVSHDGDIVRCEIFNKSGFKTGAVVRIAANRVEVCNDKTNH